MIQGFEKGIYFNPRTSKLDAGSENKKLVHAGGGEAINVCLRIRIRIRSLGLTTSQARLVLAGGGCAAAFCHSLSLSLSFSCCARLPVLGLVDFTALITPEGETQRI